MVGGLASAALLLTGCPAAVDPPADPWLSPIEHLSRASLTIRGIRPSLDEIETVGARPEALPDLVRDWLDSDAFGETIKDMHAELYLLRADTNYQLPVKGILADRGYTQADLHFSTVEAPLELVRSIVLDDAPYTDVLTVDYTLADEVVGAIYGLPLQVDGPRWQRTEWTDGRPVSGLLSDSEIWRRHVSNAANFHRGRANFVSDTFLCEDIGARDVFVSGGVDIADAFAVAEAVSTQPGCVACHNVLDPLAAFFWGYKEQLQRGAILEAYDLGCEWDWSLGEPPRGTYRVEHWCYPLKFYDVSEESLWSYWQLPPPGFFGEPASDMIDLGTLITEDPRFAECAARNFAGYLTQTDRDLLPDGWIAELQGVLVASGFSAKSLVEHIVLSDPFRAARDNDDTFAAGLQTLRPEQLGRTLDALTGFAWRANQDGGDCASGVNTCWGAVDLLQTDLFGVRSMMGGIDGYTVTHPTHTPTPTQQLALRIVAQEAAGHVVDADFQLPAASRRLLGLVEATDTDEGRIRAQIGQLYLRILGIPAAVVGPEVDALYGLWAPAAAEGGPEAGWRVVITALLRDPRMVVY